MRERAQVSSLCILERYSAHFHIRISSGIWALQLERQYPGLPTIDAIDIADVKFPSNPPSNVHFTVESVTSLPSQWTDQFDLVNQRFLFGALRNHEWVQAISEMHRVLKPGGAVQLVELIFMSPPPPNAIYAKRQQEYQRKLFDDLDLMLDAAERLPQLLVDAGFVNVVSEKKFTPAGAKWGEDGRQGSIAFGGALRGMVPVFTKQGIFASLEDGYRHMDLLMKEWDELGMELHCVIACARKPS